MLFSALAYIGATVLDTVLLLTGDFTGYLHSIGASHNKVAVVNLLLPGFHGRHLQAGVIGSVGVIRSPRFHGFD